MHVTVRPKGCIRCGACAALCPGVFSMVSGEPALAVSGDVAEEYRLAVQAAADQCPVSAIHIGP